MPISNYQKKEIEKRREFVKENYPKLLEQGYSPTNAVTIMAAKKQVTENTIRYDIQVLGI